MTVRHVVIWHVAADDPAERAELARQVATRLESLRDVVPSVRALSTAVNAHYADVNGDVILTADFDDVEGLDAYQEHPAHQEVAAFVRSVVRARAAVDYDV